MPFIAWLKAFRPLHFAITPKHALRASCGALLGVSWVVAVSHWLFGADVALRLAAPIGASSVLLFVTANTPLAHPWSLIGGNLIAGSIGLICAVLIADPALRAGLSIALAILGMLCLRCLHPPSCAVALVLALSPNLVAQWGFSILWVVLCNSLLLLACALLFNNLTGQPYPKLAAPAAPDPNRSLPSWQRTQLQQQDLTQALQQLGHYVDVRIEDLVNLLQLTEQQAFKRMTQQLTAADLMSYPVLSITAESSLDQAWELMLPQQLQALPVVQQQRVVGIITRYDLLKTLLQQPKTPKRWLSKTPKTCSVQQIMTTEVLFARPDTPILQLVKQMTEQPLHSLPIVDAEQQLVGILSQTDLIAGLYRLVLQRCHIAA